jgi:uncharacterized protein (TIGR03083 family)
MTSIARVYRDAQASMVRLLESLDADGWATTVPCTPSWTVRDVLSHVAGVTDDIANGRVEGAATDPWTAAQVDRWRDVAPALLIEQWNSQIAAVADLLEQLDEVRPAIDCFNHEHDVRHALGLDPSLPTEFLELMVARFAGVPVGPAVTITFADGATASIPGEGDSLALTGITQYEFGRSRLGRRTREQVANYDWSQPPSDELLDNWFAFGPSELPIVERR